MNELHILTNVVIEKLGKLGHKQNIKHSIIVEVRYTTIEKKGSCETPTPWPQYDFGKRNPLYPIRAVSFVSIELPRFEKPPGKDSPQ